MLLAGQEIVLLAGQKTGAQRAGRATPREMPHAPESRGESAPGASPLRERCPAGWTVSWDG